jgi:outer membrane protein assembly factor BamB
MSFGVLLAACSAGGNVETVGTSVPPSTATTALRPTSTTRPATTTTKPTPTSTTTPPRPATLADPAGVGRPWSTKVPGLLTFRGNPSRTWHGSGPVTRQPYVQWQYPQEAMCGRSREYGETRVWCGTGWVGQPAVFERGGRTWLVFGAYDYNFHFVDAHTGKPILAPFHTGDIAKGTVTVDPDGFPLVYGGSRDNKLRVLAIDRPEATELWALDAHDGRLQPHLWNDDWDSSPLVIGDYLVTGGENSRFHIVKLNRSYGPDGLVRVDPQLVFNAPTWDDELLANLPDRRVSVENSVALVGDTAYFTNSGGLLQGWDITMIRTGKGEPKRTFRFWTGDDTDASVVADAQGFLYVGQEWDRHNQRGRDIGQLLKIDPRRPNNPVVWSIPQAEGEKSGTWSTPALYGDLVIWPTYPGEVYGIERATGKIRWTIDLPYAVVSSPSVVDHVLVQGDSQGVLHGYDLRARPAPKEIWTVQLPANIESSPAIWKGRIYVGTRDGHMYAMGPKPA